MSDQTEDTPAEEEEGEQTEEAPSEFDPFVSEPGVEADQPDDSPEESSEEG